MYKRLFPLQWIAFLNLKKKKKNRTKRETLIIEFYVVSTRAVEI